MLIKVLAISCCAINTAMILKILLKYRDKQLPKQEFIWIILACIGYGGLYYLTH